MSTRGKIAALKGHFPSWMPWMYEYGARICGRYKLVYQFKDHVIRTSPETLDEFCEEAADTLHASRRAHRRKRFAGKCKKQMRRFGMVVFKADDEEQITRVQESFRHEIEVRIEFLRW